MYQIIYLCQWRIGWLYCRDPISFIIVSCQVLSGEVLGGLEQPPGLVPLVAPDHLVLPPLDQWHQYLLSSYPATHLLNVVVVVFTELLNK